MNYLRWGLVPLLFAAVAFMVWYGWGLFDERHGVPARQQVYYDAATHIRATFPPGGVGPSDETPAPPPPTPLAGLVDRFCWSIYPDRAGFDAHRRGDPDAPRVELWQLASPPDASESRPDADDLDARVMAAIEQAWPNPTPLRTTLTADAGLGGVRVSHKLRVSADGVPTVLNVALLFRAGSAWLAWSATPMNSPRRAEIASIVSGLRFAAPPTR